MTNIYTKGTPCVDFYIYLIKSVVGTGSNWRTKNAGTKESTHNAKTKLASSMEALSGIFYNLYNIDPIECESVVIAFPRL